MAIDVDSSVLWLGVGRGVRVVGSGDIGRILAFLALWGASAVCRVAIFRAVSPGIVPGLICGRKCGN